MCTCLNIYYKKVNFFKNSGDFKKKREILSWTLMVTLTSFCARSCFYCTPQLLLLLIFGDIVTIHNIYGEYSKK